MASKPEPTISLRISPRLLWLLNTQLNAASDPNQRSAEDDELISLIETAYTKARRNGKIK